MPSISVLAAGILSAIELNEAAVIADAHRRGNLMDEEMRVLEEYAAYCTAKQIEYAQLHPEFRQLLTLADDMTKICKLLTSA